MKRVFGIDIRGFWPATALTVVGLIAMGAVAEAATLLYKTPAGRQTALLIAVMRSREILDNAGVRGYYERLTGKYGKMDQDYIYDRSFRIFTFQPNLTWEHDHITTNSFGLVGREISLRKPPNTRRLAIVGASLTAGQGVPYKQAYPALLEDRLNAEKPDGPDERFEVLNFSTISYTLPQIVDTAIEEVPRFDPDVYLLDLNELAISTEWSRHLVQLTQLGIDAKYDFLRDILHQAGVSRADSTDALYGKLAPYRIAMLRGLLRTLEANVASHHASLIVMLLTSVEAGDLSKRRMATIAEVIQELHVPVVDLMDSFDEILDRSQLAAYPGDVHFNHRGHTLLFENLYRKLQAQPDAWAAVVGHPASGASVTPHP
jgi:lysophospholipase L1-like esterase